MCTTSLIINDTFQMMRRDNEKKNVNKLNEWKMISSLYMCIKKKTTYICASFTFCNMLMVRDLLYMVCCIKHKSAHTSFSWAWCISWLSVAYIMMQFKIIFTVRSLKASLVIFLFYCLSKKSLYKVLLF